MKKIFGVLALGLVASGVGYADESQDVKVISVTEEVKTIEPQKVKEDSYLKSIFANVEYRNKFVGSDGLGIAKLSTDNRVEERWFKLLAGTYVLSEKNNLDLNFEFVHLSPTMYSKIGERNNKAARFRWFETYIEIAKNTKIGNIDTKWGLTFHHKDNRKDTMSYNYFTDTTSFSGFKSVGRANEIYFGPTFKYKLFGQNASTSFEVGYFNQHGMEDLGYYLYGLGSADEVINGFGANFVFKLNNNLYTGKYGTVDYNLNLKNILKDGRGETTPGVKNKASVYMDYIFTLDYTTPEFWGGFYGKVGIENEFQRHTSRGLKNKSDETMTHFENDFYLWTTIGWKKMIPTKAGMLMINPYIKYTPFQRYTTKYTLVSTGEKITKTFEYDRLVPGLSILFVPNH